MESGPQRARADRDLGARQIATEHREGVLVAMRARVRSGDRFGNDENIEGVWHSNTEPEESIGLRWTAGVHALQGKRESAVPEVPTRQHRQRQRSAAAGMPRHTV